MSEDGSSNERKTIFVDTSMFQRVSSKKTKSSKNLAFKPTTSTMRSSGGGGGSTNPEQRKREHIIRFLMKQQEKNTKRTKPSYVTLPPSSSTSYQYGEEEDHGYRQYDPSELDQSIEYLLSLSERDQGPVTSTSSMTSSYPKRSHNQTLKTHFHPMTTQDVFPTDTNVSLEYPTMEPESSSSSMTLHPPRYGCLKNGSLPTYRQYKQHLTQKLYPTTSKADTTSSHGGGHVYGIPTSTSSMAMAYPTEDDHNVENITPPSIIMNHGHDHGHGYIDPPSSTTYVIPRPPSPPKPRPPTQQRKIARRTFRIGKHKHRPEVTVLLSNRTLRRKVNNQQQDIKQTSIFEIRKYLIKHGLMKVGSTAPEAMLRKIYEDARLTHGDVYNHNPDVLIHNFFSHDPQSSTSPYK